MRIALHHRVARPSSQLLQRVQWCAALDVPARPCVQIVPPEVLDAGALQSLVPSGRAQLLDRLILNVNTWSRCLPFCFCSIDMASPFNGTGIALRAFASSG